MPEAEHEPEAQSGGTQELRKNAIAHVTNEQDDSSLCCCCRHVGLCWCSQMEREPGA